MGLLDEIIAKLDVLPEAQLAALVAKRKAEGPVWLPNPGGQTEALDSEADELFFGGQPGPGKTSLVIGAGITRHTKSLVFRREFAQIKGLEDEVAKILGSRDGYNGQHHIWKIPGSDKTIEFGSAQHEWSVEKYQGRATDYRGFDEITHFSKTQYQYLTLWVRSTKPGQRCRIICAGNPPTTPEGLWVVEHWGPWLDENHPDPAKPGELRWPARADDDSEAEIFFRSRDEAIAHLAKLKDPPRDKITGEILPPRSRTFIPGELSENPDLAETGYTATLAHAPKHLRALARGSFSTALEDHPMQVIPTAWIIAAEKRWTERPPAGVPMTAVGVDAVQGGADEMVIAPRHDWWFAEPVAIPGVEIPLEAAGSISASHVVRVRRDNAVVGVDCGGGFGGSVVERLADNDIAAVPVKGSESGVGRTKDRQHGFANKRAEMLWRFREALDPDQLGGSPVALPPRPKLRADLAAARYTITPRGILIESKVEIKARIGRSPDWGDAVVIAWALNQGNSLPYQQKNVIRGARPVVNIGNAAVKARRRRA